MYLFQGEEKGSVRLLKYNLKGGSLTVKEVLNRRMWRITENLKHV